jgi:molybdenum cofactor sulfurtransferase
MLPLSFIEYAASQSNISLRTGCMCNPGGAVAILGAEDDMALIRPKMSLKDLEASIGRELGVVRISLGLSSNFWDIWHVIQFAGQVIGSEEGLRDVWNRWKLV